MTALSSLRRRLGSSDCTVPRAFLELEPVRALLELYDVCERETTAVCVKQPGQAYDLLNHCVGDNHIETCPVFVAGQDRLAMLNKLRGMT